MHRLLPLLMLACGPINLSGGDSADTGAGDTDADTDTDVSVDAPIIASVDDVMCSSTTDGEPAWFIQATVSDPQGLDSLAKTGSYGLIVQDGMAGEVHYGVCPNGALTISWEDPTSTEPCTLTGTVRVVAVDEDDHESAPWDYAWPAE